MRLVKKLFARHFDEILSALKDDLEGWSSLPDGPFNTDPLLEPQLDVLSENPVAWIEDSETREGIRYLYVVYVCDATIRCKKYEDNGPDNPLSVAGFAGGVTYEVPVSFEIDRESGDSFVADINCVAWQKWPHWLN
jgi:hypothetical protein